MKKNIRFASLLLVVICLLMGSLSINLQAQEKPEVKPVIDPDLMKSMKYRSIGPARGGRAGAVTGIASDPFTFYMGTSGGGVFKTTDAGLTWVNISDEYFDCGSIGAIAVAPSDENIIYVGTGETNPRGDIQTGLGLYKSTDAGKTWKKQNLISSGNIGRIRVHPKDHNIVYAAVLGHLFGPNEERGVYRSLDGGETWDKVLYKSDKAGALDIAMDVNNPRILYASIWQFLRQPWTMISGGEDSGLYKSVDGGDTWEEIKEDIPEGIKGKIGITVSPANPDRVWATIEAKEGGVFRSDDAGKTWTRINKQRSLRTRHFYYSTMCADSQDENTVYAMNVRLHKSIDGGKTWTTLRTPHGDTHDHWVNPHNPKIMINGNDGGACITLNGGRTWSTQMNQPTAEFYRVTTDNQHPYRVYGAQQDNSTISVSSVRQYVMGRYAEDMYGVGGGEQGHIRVDPRNSNIVYAGNYDGQITLYNHETGFRRNIKAWPDQGVGLPAKAYKYRFQMNAPIRLNPHNPDIIYHCSQYVHRSSNQGKTWEIISPDLTRNDVSKQEAPGGPITKDQAGGPENYCTIFAFEHSPHQQGLLWVGTDDGLVHISHDNGETWENITPKDMPEWATVNEIELSPFEAGRAFLAVQSYRTDDFKPYIYVTNDFGKTWNQIGAGTGIADNHAVRVVREDPERKGLLYAGTEFGMYVSFNDGAHWQEFQLNLPRVQISDMVRKENDLVVATHGRSFWILDNVTRLLDLSADTSKDTNFMFNIGKVYNTDRFDIDYHLAEVPEKEDIVFEFMGADGAVIRKLEIKDKAKKQLKKGMNTISWDQRYEKAKVDEKIPLWGFNAGPAAIPGDYSVKMSVGDWNETKSFTLVSDPRMPTTPQQYQAQLDLSLQIRDSVTELFVALKKIRNIRSQSITVASNATEGGFGDELKEAAKGMNEKLQALEEELVQTKLEASQDILNFPPKLYHQLIRNMNVVFQSDVGPLDSSYERFEELKKQFDGILAELQVIIDADLKAFNELVSSKNIPAVVLPSEEEK